MFILHSRRLITNLLARHPSFKLEKEKHHSRPFLLHSTCISKGRIATVLNRSIVFYIAQGAITAVLYCAVIFHISHSSVTAVLNGAIANVTNCSIATILNFAVAYIAHGFVAAILYGTIGTDIPFCTIIA